ncbi:MAG TPA: adenosine monophosphate-protein transferase [Thermoprotei archaeon]|nr:adenosine monophosphate-protein transferase [Thermoprotei archaeon]
MEIREHDIIPGEGCNIIFGQAHFIKTVEDLAEALVGSVPGIKFGLAFAESSGKRLVRYDGNDEELIREAVNHVKEMGAGHAFLVIIKNAYPINVLQAIKRVPEVVNVYCATANPVKVFLGVAGESVAVLGVADGLRPLGVEEDQDRKERKDLLRELGYKRA